MTSLTALGPKSHLRSFAQVLSQHYEVDQCLRVAAVLEVGEEEGMKYQVKKLFRQREQDGNRKHNRVKTKH